jgi:PAS domain S-box-containing protein
MGSASGASTEHVLQLALAAAENSERRMRIAQQAAHAGTWEWDLRSGTVIRSPEVEQLYGCAPGTSKPTLDWWKAHLSDEDLKRSEEQVEQMIAGRSDYHAEYQITRDDGVRRWIEAFGKVFFDEEGRPMRVVGVDRDITDRKKTEEALSASREELRLTKERFELALHSSPVTVFTTDRELRYKWVYNPRLGHNPMELIGKRDREILERADEAAWIESVKTEVLRTGVSYRGEMTVHTNGEPHTFHVSIDATRNSQCEIVGLTCACFDLTDQKRNEIALESLARQRQLALDAAEMGWWRYDPATGVGTWDETYRKIFAVEGHCGSAEKIIGLMHPEDRERAWTNLKKLTEASDAEPQLHEYRLVRPDGSVCWIEIHGAAEFAGQGESRRVASCVGTVRDITGRKLAEEALRQQRRRYDFVAEGSDVGFWFCDLPFDKLIWDKRVKNHFWMPEEIEPVTIEMFYSRLHPEDRERTRLAIETSINERSQYDVEYRTVSPDGRHKWIRAIGRGFYNETGNPVRFDGVTQDITARKQTEEALSASEARYRELAENLDRQIQARTLELEQRNHQMLRASDGLRELSGRVLRVQDEERRRIARELHDSAGQILTALGLELGSLAQDLHKVAPQLESNLAEALELVQQLHREIRTTSYLLHPPLLDEAGLHSALSWYLDGLRERSGIEIDLDVAEGFGRLPRDIELVIFRLIQESVTNIHRHSGSASAEIRMARESDAVTIEVQDHGKGMSEEELRKIREGGSGVGIRGMRERLRQFHGELRIESGRLGTQVLVRIPIPQAAVMELGSESLHSAV